MQLYKANSNLKLRPENGFYFFLKYKVIVKLLSVNFLTLIS